MSGVNSKRGECAYFTRALVVREDLIHAIFVETILVGIEGQEIYF